MPLFTFETNASPGEVPTWSVECETAQDAMAQAVVTFGEILRSTKLLLCGGGPLSLWVSDKEGRVLLKLQMTAVEMPYG